MDFVPAGPVVLHACRDGDPAAPTLVLVNPLGADRRIWERLVPHLGDRAHVVRYDQRGHGLSDRGSGGFGIEELADDLARLLAQLDTGPAVVCGVELGGFTALALAARRPAAVAGLVLASTGVAGEGPTPMHEQIARVRAGGLAAVAPDVLDAWFGRTFVEQRPAEACGWRNMLLRTGPEAYLAGADALARALVDATDLAAGASAVRVPTLCLAGAFEPPAQRAEARALAGRIAGAEFAIAAGCARLGAVVHPVDLAARLAAFIERCHGGREVRAP